MTRIVAVVPAYDEEGAIADVVREITAFDPAIDVVVVDDGSSDATAETAVAAGAAVVRLPFNVGIGGAVQTGFRYAVRLERKEDLPRVIAELVAFRGPAFLEVIIDPDAGVYPMVGPGQAYDEMITLPLWPGMSDGDVDDVVTAVRRVLTAYRQ